MGVESLRSVAELQQFFSGALVCHMHAACERSTLQLMLAGTNCKIQSLFGSSELSTGFRGEGDMQPCT